MGIKSGKELERVIRIEQGMGRLEIDNEMGGIHIHDDINNEAIFIDFSVWGEVRDAIDTLVRSCPK